MSESPLLRSITHLRKRNAAAAEAIQTCTVETAAGDDLGLARFLPEHGPRPAEFVRALAALIPTYRALPQELSNIYLGSSDAGVNLSRSFGREFLAEISRELLAEMGETVATGKIIPDDISLSVTATLLWWSGVCLQTSASG